MIETGANWIQGGSPNPMFQMSEALGLRTAFERFGDAASSYDEAYDSQGRQVSHMGRTGFIEGPVDACLTLQAVKLATEDAGSDKSVREGLSKCGLLFAPACDATETDATRDMYARQHLLARLLFLACLITAAAEMDADEPTAALPQPGQRVRRAVPAAGKRASSGKPAQVQFVITNAMRAELTRLGYSEADMDERSPAALTAERAKAIVDYGIRRPTRELPRSWTRAGQKRRGGLLSSKLLSPGTILTASAIAWAACAVDPACLRGLERVSRKVLRTLSKVARLLAY